MSGDRSLSFYWGVFFGVMTGVLILVAMVFFFPSRQNRELASAQETAGAAPTAASEVPAQTDSSFRPAAKTLRRTPAPSRASRLRAPSDPAESLALIKELVTVPAGTRLDVLLDQRLSTETNQVGDSFRVSLARALVINGETVLEQGTRFTGKIIDLERPGKVSGVAKITLVLTIVSINGESTAEVQTVPLIREGETTKGKDAVKVGVGAGIGAVIGRIFGGGGGAAKGAAVGAAGGAGAVAATRGKDLVLAPEQELTFTLAKNATFEAR